MRKLSIILCIFVFLLLLTGMVPAEKNEEGTEKTSGEKSKRKLINIPINPLMDFDFKSKSEIFNIRRRFVTKHRNLIDGSYSPSKEVFGQIVGGKAWWGIDGLIYYGAGKKSIEGPSDESRFICNPFILVGLDEGVYYRGKGRIPREKYPRPVSLVWSADRKYGKVIYAIRRFWASHYPGSRNRKERKLELVAYNARDLGYKYLYIDMKKSRYITLLAGKPRIIRIPQFIHVGGSCGYPGGCNNMSPYCKDLLFRSKRYPSRVVCKLWKNKPINEYTPADMEFVVDMR